MPELDNAPAANDEGGQAAPPPAPAPDPNDLGTEMTEAEESAFVDRQLGITDSGAPFGVAPKEEDKGDADNADEKTESKPGEPDKKPADPDKADPNPDDPSATGGAAKPANEEPETPPAKEAEQTPKTEAPKEVDTTDLWVELEDANGKSFKIGVNDPVPEDLVFKNDAQLAEFAEARIEMKGTLRERNAEFEKAQADAAAKDSSAKTEADQLASWDGEIQDLITAGLIEAPKAKPGDAEFLKDPSVQKIDAVFKFMGAQNAERGKAGKQPIMSFGTAYTLWANDKAKKEAEDAQTKSNQIAKERGALVGGGSSSSSGGGNAGLYEQGSAGSIHDLNFDDLL